MAVYKQNIVDIELNSGNVHRSFLKHSIGTGDSAADRFGVRVFRDKEEVDLDGVSCQGFFRNSRGENIALTSAGTVDGNIAYVTLPQACYNYEGPFCLSIKLIGGGVTGTMRIVDGMVDNTNTGSAVAPTETVPTYQEVLAVYDDMVEALEEVDKLNDALINEDQKTADSFGFITYADIDTLVINSKNPSATNASKLGLTRRGTTALLDGGGLGSTIFFKMNGSTTGKTTSSSTVKSWAEPLTLETNKDYIATAHFISGVKSSMVAVSIYKSGENSTIGQTIESSEKTFSRRFTYDGTPVHIAVYVPANATFENALFNITLEEAESQTIRTAYSKIDDLEVRVNTAGNLINYNYQRNEGFPITAGAAANSVTRLGIRRNGTHLIADGGNINANAYVRLSGKLYRTVTGNDIKGLSTGITLTPNAKYRVTMEHISGTVTGGTGYASISVYKLGENSSIGSAKIEGNKYIREFTAPDETINIIFFTAAGVTYSNAEYCIILEEIGSNESTLPYIKQGTKNINDFATLWTKGGLGSDGSNYNDRTTSIRTNNYWRIDNILSITCSTDPIYLCLYDADYTFIIRKDYTNTTIDYTEIVTAYPTAVYYRIEIRGVNGALSAYDSVTVIGREYPAGLETHKVTKEKARLMQAHRTGSETYDTCDFRALIVSDVHEEYARFGNIIALLNHWGLTEYFDVMLNCGDTVRTLQGQDLGWHNAMIPYIQIPYMNIVGNHDAYDTLGHIGNQLTTYQNIIAPIAGQTGIVQPTGAASNGLCYYYFDVNSKYRVIALDCIYWDTTEATWLENVLASAKTNELAVVCMSHYGFSSQYVTYMPSLWREVSGAPSDQINIAAAEKVSAFMEGGGTFICWLIGHSHSDNLYKLTEYNQQLVITFPSLAQRAGNLLKSGDANAYNYIAATQMTIDDYQHTVRFMRIGANIDTWGVQHNGLVLDYVNRTLIAAW